MTYDQLYVSAPISLDNSYKMRAECLNDVAEFIRVVNVSSLKVFQMEVNGIKFPDAIVEFESELSLIDIRTRIRQIPDGHVMMETVDFQAKYTGERKL